MCKWHFEHVPFISQNHWKLKFNAMLCYAMQCIELNHLFLRCLTNTYMNCCSFFVRVRGKCWINAFILCMTHTYRSVYLPELFNLLEELCRFFIPSRWKNSAKSAKIMLQQIAMSEFLFPRTKLSHENAKKVTRKTNCFQLHWNNSTVKDGTNFDILYTLLRSFVSILIFFRLLSHFHPWNRSTRNWEE